MRRIVATGHEQERGAAATLLVVTGVILGLAIVTMMVIPLAIATDAKSRNRTAADAAALAGAEAILGDLEEIISSGTWSGSWSLLDDVNGQARAREYAERNDAELTAYRSRIDGLTFVVDVSVRSDEINEDGQRARSDARAEVGLPDCEFRLDDPPPPTTPPPSDEDDEDDEEEEGEEEPEEPTPVDQIVTCDGRTWTISPTGDPADPDYDLPSDLVSTLLAGLEARLVA